MSENRVNASPPSITEDILFIGKQCYKIVKGRKEMKKPMSMNTLKRNLIIGIIFLFLSAACLPVLASEGKPDLIIEDMGFAPHNGIKKVFYTTIKNIGDAKAYGIQVQYTFIRMLFGIIPIKNVFAGVAYHTQVVSPQNTTDFFLISTLALPKIGFFEIDCTVNPEKIIEESNYDNNNLTMNYIALFGFWIKRV